LLSKEKQIVKHRFQLQVSLAFAILFAAWLSSCSKESTAEAITAGTPPVNEIDAMINDYEKVTNQYLRMARKLKGGDLSLTLPYIELGKETRKYAAQLQQISVKMTPQQAQRVASISAKTAPYLQN
jgi:hypothetical protein